MQRNATHQGKRGRETKKSQFKIVQKFSAAPSAPVTPFFPRHKVRIFLQEKSQKMQKKKKRFNRHGEEDPSENKCAKKMQVSVIALEKKRIKKTAAENDKMPHRQRKQN